MVMASLNNSSGDSKEVVAVVVVVASVAATFGIGVHCVIGFTS